MHATIQVLIAIVLVFAISLYRLIAITTGERRERRALLVLGALSPVLIFVAAVGALFRRPEVHPCPARLEEAEREVELRRGEIFARADETVYLARTWQEAYKEYLDRSAEAVHRFVETPGFRKAA